MGKNPYSDFPKSAFWKTGVAQENPYAIEGIYKKKFDIPANAKIATAGSCFAQHISRHLKKNGYNVLDVEPPPPGLPENLHQKFGFSMYSARYGNIYTVRQLLQLAQEVAGEWTPQNYIWEKNGKFYDALRPAVEPEGLDSPEEVVEHRQYHVSQVKELFESLDLFIFTLGLTEMWVHKESGTVYPTAPGTLVGEFDESLIEFKNAQFAEIIGDFNQFQKVLKNIRDGKPFKCLLTVSPVPLTATASGKHVLTSTMYSKSTLRSIAGQLSTNEAHIDYFPSYEIVTNPRMHSSTFADNLRSVRNETVETVMNHFFQEHVSTCVAETMNKSDIDSQCEEALLDAFANDSNPGSVASRSSHLTEILGNSHLAGLKTAVNKYSTARSCFYYPLQWMNGNLSSLLNSSFPSHFDENFFRKNAIDKLSFPDKSCKRDNLVFVGMGMFGDGILRCFGPILSNNVAPPIVGRDEDISATTSNKFESQLLNLRSILDKIHKRIEVDHFSWIAAPMPPHKCAIERFGAPYVDSSSQKIYNMHYRKIAENVLGSYYSDGTIIMQCSETIDECGFTKDKYGAYKHSSDIHCNASYYQVIVETNAEIFC